MEARRILTLDKQLGYSDETEHVHGEHGFDVGVGDLSDLLDTQDEASVVNCSSAISKDTLSTQESRLRTEDIDLPELLRDIVEEGGDLLLVAHIKRDSHEFATLLETRLLVRGRARFRDGLEGIHSACSQDHVRAALRGPSIHQFRPSALDTLNHTFANRIAVACSTR